MYGCVMNGECVKMEDSIYQEDILDIESKLPSPQIGELRQGTARFCGVRVARL
jgi:hypothetical protein